MNDDEEGDVEVDAADHSVGNHGRTHGTGSNLVHGHVDKERKSADVTPKSWTIN